MTRRGSFKRTGRTLLVALVACASLVATIVDHGALGSVKQEGLRDTPVVMIALDELPIATLMNESGNIDAHLFPNFARIQRDSTWFRNTTTPAVFTREALPAILTGLYPSNTRPDRESIFALVDDEYEIPLTHEHDVLELPRGRSAGDAFRGVCPESACENASASMMDLADRYGHLFPGPQGAEFLRLLSFIRQDEHPRFYFLHYVMPHQPWRYFPTGQEYTGTNSLPGQVNEPGPAKEWIDDEWLVAQAYQRHLLQTALLDRQLGVLIDHLEEHDLYDQSLVLITADHGVAFEPEASKRVVTEETTGHISAVPFFMKEPFQDEGRISDLPLETVDVVPTLIDALGSPDTRVDADGISAFSPDFPDQRERKTDETVLTSHIESKFDVAQMKYEVFGRDGDRLDLFDLGPGRTRTLVGEDIAEFELTSPSDVVATVDNKKRIESASRGMPRLPGLLKGTLRGRDTHRRNIAVVIDGRVEAVTRSFRNPRGAHLVHFYALLPPGSFSSPPNDLDLYFVEDAATRTLTLLVEQ